MQQIILIVGATHSGSTLLNLIRLNSKQAEHLASTLRAYGLGQVAAFGHTGIQTGHWLIVVVSGALALTAEAAAMIALKSIGEKQ